MKYGGRLFTGVPDKIYAAFEKKPLSEDISVCKETAFDEDQYLIRVVQRKNWWDLLDEFLNRDDIFKYDVFSFFSAESFCYYLPFFLVYAASRAGHEGLENFEEALVYHLTYPCIENKDLLLGDFEKKRKACLVALSDKQKAAVAAYLTAYMYEFDEEDAMELLDCYWDPEWDQRPLPFD